MKRLILCCDGTWNTPDMEDNGVTSPTNVFKFYNLLARRDGDGIEQRRYYQPGVGTDGLVDRKLGGALGIGLDEKINDAFLWLGLNYEPGDEIYIVGFSRGAFVARCLAGYLGKGLIDFRKMSVDKVRKTLKTCYEKVYKDRSDDPWNGMKGVKLFAPSDWGDSQVPIRLPERAIKVKFVGVWDTVGSLGIPDDLELVDMLLEKKERWEFHDRNLGYHVETGRHAMGLDEMRACFTVTHWSNTRGTKAFPKHPDILESWFPGVHSDIGGGYSDDSLSSGTLLWMMEQAQKKELVFREGALDSVKECYDPLGEIHNSFKGLFALLPSRPRNVPCLEKPSTPTKATVMVSDAVYLRQKMVCPKFPCYRHTVELAPDETSEPVDIFAEQRWNYTGLYLRKGRYYFDGSGLWMDGKDVCDWKGTENDQHTFGDGIRWAAGLLGKLESVWKTVTNDEKADFAFTKRCENVDWFRMVGCIANDNGTDKDKVVAHDGSPEKHQYVDLTVHTRGKKPLEVKHPGYLYAFANDIWAKYENNDGIIRLVVHRLKD